MTNLLKQTATATALVFGLAAQPAAAQNVKLRVFDACAETALSETPEAAGDEFGSSLSIGPAFANMNGTSLEVTENRKQVIAKGPGAETAMDNFMVCAKANGQSFIIRFGS